MAPLLLLLLSQLILQLYIPQVFQVVLPANEALFIRGAAISPNTVRVAAAAAAWHLGKLFPLWAYSDLAAAVIVGILLLLLVPLLLPVPLLLMLQQLASCCYCWLLTVISAPPVLLLLLLLLLPLPFCAISELDCRLKEARTSNTLASTDSS